MFREANSSWAPRVKIEEKCEVRGTDNVQGQISVHSFFQIQMEAIVFITPYCPSISLFSLIFFSTRVIGEFGNMSWIFFRFSWAYLVNDENIWWITKLGNIWFSVSDVKLSKSSQCLNNRSLIRRWQFVCNSITMQKLSVKTSLMKNYVIPIWQYRRTAFNLLPFS